jgi:hypothetical protein
VICVSTMAKISKEAEACMWNERFFEDMMRSVCSSVHYVRTGYRQNRLHGLPITLQYVSNICAFPLTSALDPDS